jgi:hypothetical protein
MIDDNSRMTTDHRVIQGWIEERGGTPAKVGRGRAAQEEQGVLRILFPGQPRLSEMEPMEWDKFFERFDQAHLAFMYQDRTISGEKSRFFKFVSRNGE